MKFIYVVLLIAMMVPDIAAAGENEIIQGASEFLVDRAGDNAMYVFERKTRDNPYFRVFFPNTCDYLSNASFKQLFLSNYLLKKTVGDDVKNILKESSLIYILEFGDLPVINEGDLDKLFGELKTISKDIDRAPVDDSIKAVNALILVLNDKIKKRKIEINNELNVINETYTCKKTINSESKSIAADFDKLLTSIGRIKGSITEQIKKLPKYSGDDEKAAIKLERFLEGRKLEKLTSIINEYYKPKQDGVKNRIEEVARLIEDIVEMIAAQEHNADNKKPARNFEMVLKAEKYVSTLFVLSDNYANLKAEADRWCILCGDGDNKKKLIKELDYRYEIKYIETGADYRHFRKSILLLAQMSDAESKEQVKELLRTALLPSVSFGEKRIPGEHKLFLSSYFGVAAQYGNSRSTNSALFVPVGLEYAYGCTNIGLSICPAGKTIGIMFGIFDFGVPVNLSLYDRDSEVDLEDVLQPGLYFNFGLRDYPVTLGIGLERGRILSDGVSQNIEKDTRFLIYMAFDMPLFALF